MELLSSPVRIGSRINLSPSVLKSKSGIRNKLKPSSQQVTKDPEILKWVSTLFEYRMIPFSDSDYHGLAIAPHDLKSNSIQKVIDDMQIYRTKINELKLFAPSPYEQSKYQQTSLFLNKVFSGIQSRQGKFREYEWA